MKKKIIIVALFTLISVNIVSAAGILDYFQEAQWSITPNAGYVGWAAIEVSSIDQESVVVTTPIVQTELEETMGNYVLMYGTNTLSDLLEDSSLIDNFQNKSFKVTTSAIAELDLNLDLIEDWLNLNDIYYAWVLPIDEWDIVWTMSNQVCFRLWDWVFGTGDSCKYIVQAEVQNEEVIIQNEEEVIVPIDEEHDAAGTDLNLANITYTVTSGKINLAWMSLDDTENLNIFLRDESANIFKELGTVSMATEAYQFNADTSKTNLVKILPVNGGREVIESIRAEQPKITEVPQTGPKENAIAIMFLTLLWYVFYRSLAKRKA